MITINGYKKILAAILAVLMSLTFASCGDDDIQVIPEAQKTVLNVGYGAISGEFNPFYTSEGVEADVCTLTGVQLFEIDRGGSVVMDSRPVKYLNTQYTYDGIATCEVITQEDGSVAYAITLREDVYFSDGEQLTADDVIFTMYVLSDPAYDGPYTFSSLPIVGMNDYRAGMFVLSGMIFSAGEDNADFSYWTEEQQETYWQTLKGSAGEQFAQEIIDYCVDNGYAEDVTGAMKRWGYSHVVDEGRIYTAADFFKIICEEYNYDYKVLGYEEAAGKSLFDIAEEQLVLVDPAYATAVMVSESEPTISGIEKTGEFSLTVTTERFDSATSYALALNVAPMHYYGDSSLFDVQKGSFGFTKGDLSHIKSVTEPMGAGPYEFGKFDGNKVTFTANENYYKGAPSIPEIAFISYTSSESMVSAVANGQLDLCSPELSADIVSAVKDINGNGDLTGDKITYSPVDFNGYGFIGINANKVYVNGYIDSAASKNLRKAFAILFAAYREEAVEAYYGELAEVIEYPISSTSWAAPSKYDGGYSQAYSYDAEYKAIYTDNMTREERYEAALEAAKGCFIAAGYTWSYSEDRFVAAPDDAKMSYTIIVPGSGKGDHPCYSLAEKVSEALDSIGIELVIDDPIDTNRLWAALNSGSQDMWCAAWTGSIDPDLYRVYHSSNYPTNSEGTGKNYFYLLSARLDEMILEARITDNTYLRKGIYFDCLREILEWAVEIPVYQRQQAYIYSTERIDIDSLPDEMTSYRRWISGIEKISLK